MKTPTFRNEKMAEGPEHQNTSTEAGFHRVDLLCLLGMLLLLALLLSPALAHTRASDQAFVCCNNLSRLLNAWRMYAEDNGDRVPSAFGKPTAWMPPLSMSWSGNTDTDGQNPANWDPELTIEKSVLWPYCGNRLDLWRCPSDAPYSCRVTSGAHPGQYPRVRSYSMNGWFNSSDAQYFGQGFKLYTKLSDCLQPGPARTIVFAHERLDSVNDGEFLIGMDGYPNQPSRWLLVDYPTCQHDGAGSFAFVDGHTEIKRWMDRRTMPRISPMLGLASNMPNNPDSYWLMDHSTRAQ
jgi:prepilin-type processing-associated H-X9-DG protein